MKTWTQWLEAKIVCGCLRGAPGHLPAHGAVTRSNIQKLFCIIDIITQCYHGGLQRVSWTLLFLSWRELNYTKAVQFATGNNSDNEQAVKPGEQFGATAKGVKERFS